MTAILVTAGPTREYLDGVRYLANGSTGRMGFAIAAAAVARGHEVRLVAGPTELAPPAGVQWIPVVSAREMCEAALRAFDGARIAFGVAAVADFRPARVALGKPPKEAVSTTLELIPNPDVIAALGAVKGDRRVVGFALEDDTDADAAERAARAKLARKQLDLIVLNALPTMGASASRATLLWADGRREELPELDKRALGELLLDRVLACDEARR